MDVTTPHRPVDMSSLTAAAAPQPLESRRGRGGLFRKYLVLFIGLVAAALLLNAGIEVAFTYREHQAMLERLQGEKADAAAQRIAQFVSEIERQIGWTTQGQWAQGFADDNLQSHALAMFLLTEAQAATIRANYEQRGELSAVGNCVGCFRG
jgi:two-component system NtrC family sensor kinase